MASTMPVRRLMGSPERLRRKHICESLELFAEEVMPQGVCDAE